MFIYYLVFAFIIVVGVTPPLILPRKKRSVLLCFAALLLLFSLRRQTMGIDLSGYLKSFDYLSSVSWGGVLTLDSYQNYEKGYVVLNKIVGSIFPNRQFMLSVCALLSLAPAMYTIYKLSETPIQSILVYMGLPTFVFLFSGLRQSIAIGLCSYAICLIKQKKLIRFVLMVLVATFFHSSAIVFLIAYPLYHSRVNKRIRSISIVSLPLIFAFKRTIYYTLLTIIGKDVNRYTDNNGAVTLFVVFSLVYLFCCLLSEKGDFFQNGLLNIFYVACAIQALAGLYSVITRLGFYFMMALPLLLPSVCSEASGRGDSLIRKKPVQMFFVRLFFCFCFIAFGLWQLFSTYWSISYPYYFFWQ